MKAQRSLVATGLALALALPFTTTAQDRFPTRTIQLVVPFSAGSQTDIVARAVGRKMSAHWGRPVVVVNRPGGGGIVAARAVAGARPDGYTLLVHSAAFAVSATLYSKLPYDTVADFAPVSQMAIVPLVLVEPSLKVKSANEFIALAKRSPQPLFFGSAGIGSGTHLCGEKFRFAAGINVVHVPYKGTPEALVDTIGGRIQFLMSPIEPALPLIKDGKLLALAVTTAQRSTVLPNVPTVSEAGLAGFQFEGSVGVWAPARTPAAILHQLSNEIGRIVNLPDVRESMLSRGLVPKSSSPEEFAKFTRVQIEEFGKIVKASGARAE